MPINRTFSVGEYMPLAHREIDDALAAGRTPIVVGGTGLYLRAALSELDLKPPPSADLRSRLEDEADSVGAEAMHARLAVRAPQAAAKVAPADRSRVIRLLELLEMGALEDEEPQVESQLWTEDTRHPTLLAGLTMDRAALYERIDRRVDAMVGAGALEEVKAAHEAGASATARKALGFEQLLAGRHRGDEDAQPPVRAAPAHLDAQAAERAPDRRDRAQPGRGRGRDRASVGSRLSLDLLGRRLFGGAPPRARRSAPPPRRRAPRAACRPL